MSFSLKRFLVISASVSKVDLASTVTFTSYDVPLLLLVRKYPFLIASTSSVFLLPTQR